MKYVVAFFLSALLLDGFSQKKIFINKMDSLKNGTTVLYHIKITEPKKFSLHNYYKTTETTRIYFNKSGNIICKQFIIEKIGSDALPCEELLFIQREYFTGGKLKSYWKIKCDGHKVWRKEYNPQGQLLNKQRVVIKRYY